MTDKKLGRPLSAPYSLELGFSFPTRVGRNLEKYRHIVLNQDDDCAIIIDGDEGAGKSMVAQQIAYFLDIDTREQIGAHNGMPIHEPTGRKLEIDQICFNKEQLFKAIRELPPFKAIVYDEGARSSDRRNSISEENITFNQMMREVRQYNKFIIIVHQSFYDMDMQMAVRRSQALINIRKQYKDLSKAEGLDRLTPLVRGAARVYTKQGKSDLYNNKFLRSRFAYPLLANESFDVMFGFHWVVDHEAYKKKKDEATAMLETKEPPKCPECGAKIYYRRSEEIWRCRSCPWEGTPPSA